MISHPPHGNEVPCLLTPGDVSQRLGVPTGTLANWRYLGRGPAFLRVGRHVRYRPDDVEAWLDGQRHETDRHEPTLVRGPRALVVRK